MIEKHLAKRILTTIMIISICLQAGSLSVSAEEILAFGVATVKTQSAEATMDSVDADPTEIKEAKPVESEKEDLARGSLQNMNTFNEGLNTLILILLSISTLITVLDMIGFIPERMRKLIKRSHASDTLDVLRDLGVDIPGLRNSNIAFSYPVVYSKESVEECVTEELKKITINKEVSIGHNRKIKIKSYIDLIGHSCNREYSGYYAQQLCDFLAEVTRANGMQNPSFNYVVTPKGGSPILGYEFANLINKPFVLHEEKQRFKDKNDDFRQFFDCAEIPPAGSIFLIVDDSITGGTMVIKTIQDLRHFGYNVVDCLVVFELTNKNGRRQINNEGVNLLSIVQVHQ